MADIRSFPLTRHLRSLPTSHVVHMRRGRVAHEGVGISFYFRALNAAISEVPTHEVELHAVFQTRTNDFQAVAVQVTVTYRFDDPGVAARRLDFSIDPYSGAWLSNPLAQVSTRITELAQQYAMEYVATSGLVDLLARGLPAIRQAMIEGLAGDQRLAETSIFIAGVRIVSARPVPELEKALETPVREKVQQEADKAGFERRALAVERERAIAENELQSKIELATREQQLVVQEGANTQRRAAEAAAADKIAIQGATDRSMIESEGWVAREKIVAGQKAETLRITGAAIAEAETLKLASYRGVDPAILLALAAQSVAGNLPQIGSINFTPDVISAALARLGVADSKPKTALVPE